MIKHKPIEDYLLRNSNVERARENVFLKHAYEELAVELGDTCPICNKFVDDVDDHIDKVHGGTQKTLFEEAFGKPYQVSGGWEELDPPRYPHSKLPKEFVGDERNLTEDFSEEFFDTADIMEEYDNIPTDNMKHQTQNLQNSIDEGRWDEEQTSEPTNKDLMNVDDARKKMLDQKRYLDLGDIESDIIDPRISFQYQIGGETLPEQDGTFYTHDGKAEDWDIPYYKVPDNYYTDKGDEQSNYLKDTRHEERDVLKGYGIADKTLHELGLDELEEGKVEDATIDIEKWLETRDEEDIVHDADMYDKVKDLGYDEDTADKVAFDMEGVKDVFGKIGKGLQRALDADFPPFNTGEWDLDEVKATEDERSARAVNYSWKELTEYIQNYLMEKGVTKYDWNSADHDRREMLFRTGSEESKATEGAHGSGRRGHEQWMNPTEIIDKKTDEDLRRDNFITRAEEIIEDFKPEFTSEQLLKTDCSNCSQKSYDKIFKAFEDK